MVETMFLLPVEPPAGSNRKINSIYWLVCTQRYCDQYPLQSHKGMQIKLLHWLTWLLNCGLAPAPAVGHPPPAPAGPPWIGVPVLEGATECVTPFWRDIWASICPADGPGCAICGVICELILTCLLRRERSERGLLLVIYWRDWSY